MFASFKWGSRARRTDLITDKTTRPPSRPRKSQSVTNNNMVIISHPPYSAGLAPSDFATFPKLEIKLKGRRFETVSDIQMQSQRKMTSTVLFKRGKRRGIFIVYNLILFSFHYATHHQNILTVISNIKIYLSKSTVRITHPY
jgi:hypothetical protein